MFDGYRVQVHRDGPNVTIYSRNGHDFADRYPAIARDILKIPTKQFIIDAELTACNRVSSDDNAPIGLYRRWHMRFLNGSPM
jgi:ATP-dependent DNA ligase